MKKKYIEILFVILMVLTVAFIFSRSAMPPERSEAESDKVGDIIGEVIPPQTEVGGYIQLNLRKLAHFTEFFVLGAEVSLFVVLFVKRIKYAALSIPAAAIIALFDETIQIFSGRGPSVKDIWIDVLGFVSAAAIIYTVYIIIYFIRKNANNN